ncbi:MAG: carboxypeptidase-like regulatory domain-containing protein [Planctomycetota bacterium]
MEWTGNVGPEGTFEIGGLPPHVPLEVTVRSDREDLLCLPSRLSLQPGEHHVVEWIIGAGAILSGLAVNAADGHPESDLEIWLLPGAETLDLYFRGYEQGARKTRSDWQGRFRFTGLSLGEWAVGPGPREPAPDEASIEKEAAPAVTRFEVADGESTVEVIVEVYRGFYITGLVLDPDGQPAPDVSVHGYDPQGGGTRYSRCEKDGRFQFGPVVPALYSLCAGETSSGFARSDFVEARSGQAGVVLKLRRGASIWGQVKDALTGSGESGWIWLQGVEPWGYEGMNTKPDGRFAFTSVEPGRHHLIARTDDGRVGYLKNIVVGVDSPAAELELLVGQGGRVRVHYDGPSEMGQSQRHLRRGHGPER